VAAAGHFDISALTMESVKPFGLGNKEALRCKNMWTLGLALWMFDRDRAADHRLAERKFAKNPILADANIAALNAGHAYGETAEIGTAAAQACRCRPRDPGLYRTVTGAEAISLWAGAGAQLAGLPMFFGGYPITPASRSCTILARPQGIWRHHLPGGRRDCRDRFGHRRILCRSAGRHLVVRPRHCAEGRGDGPCDHDRAAAGHRQLAAWRPSTGLPTKTEQSDLYQAVYGRNGDAPMPVIAARSPSDAFDCAIEAVRIAVSS
jgi:2-oxoglutarate ferredoxin oxidoreductase subunit alpha